MADADDAGTMYAYNPTQEAAEPRKMYGTGRTPDFASLMPSVGDPVFDVDAQNNDEFYILDSDVPRDIDDTSQPSYGLED